MLLSPGVLLQSGIQEEARRCNMYLLQDSENSHRACWMHHVPLAFELVTATQISNEETVVSSHLSFGL